ncbi:hypothetical protein LNP05_00615 [Klebsiella pneumoniae subsp. pneumoniae]|nr:hypothetical protein [Klebsiella pneumoniae subsp. pneumoniae]
MAGRGEYQWILTTEDGKQYQGKTRGGETLPLPAKLPEGVPLPDPHPGGGALALPDYRRASPLL